MFRTVYSYDPGLVNMRRSGRSSPTKNNKHLSIETLTIEIQ